MRFTHWFYTLPLRLRSLFRRNQVEQELDEELRYHLERICARLLRFMLHSPTIMSTGMNLTPKSSGAGKRSMRLPLLKPIRRFSKDCVS
jgi:hypothetical protein